MEGIASSANYARMQPTQNSNARDITQNPITNSDTARNANIREEQHVLDFRCYFKNVMSLMSEEREQLLFEELTTIEWDIILLNETWRPREEEIWTTSGHLFLGSGGTPHSSGVAVILHKKWVHCFKAFKRYSERLCFLDINIKRKKIRFVVPYMPTAWHDDALVEEMYSNLSEICSNARSKSRTLVVCGDFNAVVGERHVSDNEEFVGSFGIGSRNERGKQLVEWATSERLVVANTRLRKSFDKLWTQAMANNSKHRGVLCYQHWRRSSMLVFAFANHITRTSSKAA